MPCVAYAEFIVGVGTEVGSWSISSEGYVMLVRVSDCLASVDTLDTPTE